MRDASLLLPARLARQVMEEGGGVEARVWTRPRLAELCGIDEDQVVEWAIFMGNDYTRHLSFGHLGVSGRNKGRPERVSGGVFAKKNDGDRGEWSLRGWGSGGGGGGEISGHVFYFVRLLPLVVKMGE